MVGAGVGVVRAATVEREGEGVVTLERLVRYKKERLMGGDLRTLGVKDVVPVVIVLMKVLLLLICIWG